MSKLTVEDTSLVSVANAIRTKGGTTGALTFPDGFVSAIEGIQSGGGDDGAFASLVDGSITEVTADMLRGCVKIRTQAFYSCSKLTSIIIPEGVTLIDSGAFSYCSALTGVNLPSSVTSIGSTSFYYCSALTGVNLPSSVTSIGSSAFSYCYKLTSIIIPEGVTSIGNQAFYNCRGLTEVYVNAITPPTLGTNVFKNCTALTQIIVPAGSLSAYQSATNWSAYADLMVEALS